MIVLSPLLQVIRNRWDIACTFTYAADGSPVDLTVTPPFAEFYQRTLPMLDLRVGSGIVLSASRGNCVVSLLGAVTGGVTMVPQDQTALKFPYRFEIGLLDATGEKISYALQPIGPIEPASIDATQVGALQAPLSIQITIPTILPVQVAVGVPGPPGPSAPSIVNSLIFG